MKPSDLEPGDRINLGVLGPVWVTEKPRVDRFLVATVYVYSASLGANPIPIPLSDLINLGEPADVILNPARST